MFLISLFLLSTGAVIGDTSFQLKENSLGGYSVNIGSNTWLKSAPSFVTGNNQTFSTDPDAKSKLVATDKGKTFGHDNAGSWNATYTTYKLGANNIYVKLVTKQYDSFIVFEQQFLNDTKDTGFGIFTVNQTSSGFPSFYIEEKVNIGFLAFGGIFNGATDLRSGRWGPKTVNAVSGLRSGPLVLFNKSGSTVIVSSFKNFMAGSVFYDIERADPTMSWGLMGSIREVPKDFTLATVVYCGEGGIRQSMEDWGIIMRKYYGKHTNYRQSDLSITHLGYYTANGAYYYYHTEKNKQYEKTLEDIGEAFLEEKLPVRSIEYDSWWYPKDKNGAVTEWISLNSVFPDGIQSVYNATQIPVVGHNRWWSNETLYAKHFDFIVESNGYSIPQDLRFWDYLMKKSKIWGLINYEQDWLHKQFDNMASTTQNVNVGRNWLMQMGKGAEKNGITIQYCMAPSRHVLQSLEIPVVTQVRVSSDYQPGFDENWKIGISSMFANAMGLAPFKDLFWSTSVQPGNTYGPAAIEPHTYLHAVVATISTGPVTPGDAVGKMDASLIMKSCNEDGLILMPSKPAFAIDPQIWQMALQDGSGPEGHVFTTYSEIAGMRFGIVLAAGFDNSSLYSLLPEHAGLGADYSGYAYSYGACEKVALKYSTTNPMVLKGCTSKDFCLNYISQPISLKVENKLVEVVLYGECSKWVPMSPQRVNNIVITSDNVYISLRGASNEKVQFYFMVNETVLSLVCSLDSSGMAHLNIINNTCIGGPNIW